ncbi:MAG TPA: NUDIX hydrolase [Polyangiales bacterium]|nr:NUDIX hydrolase [Polyangiales bacterium]
MELPIRLAATVVVLRDSAQGPEVLLVQRANELAFHGGAWVFPGGRVDPEDFAAIGATPSETLSVEEALEVSRHAAVREAREESGLTLDAASLVPFSHWTTPVGRSRRFATWFFAVVLGGDAIDVVVDGGEIRAHQWARARDALSACDAGSLVLPAPTFVTLSQLSKFASSAEWLTALASAELPVYLPKLHVRAEGEVTVYQGDVAYEGGELEQEGPRHRLNMLKSGWSYLRTPR